ncbi:Imm70 family immunity protein [Carnobacterium gallinarum]|uniref:Imm70 family immunity protein n=1 Tax=Carnobacterium gallinarum TaxID=2749 RepID=UPI0005558F53
MTVGIKVDFLWFPIGRSDFFHSFFSTICINLENKQWGNLFPIIMNELYSGEIANENLKSAQKELRK